MRIASGSRSRDDRRAAARRLVRPAVVLAILGLAIAPLAAQTSYRAPGGAYDERGNRRLFQRFVEDAAITPGGWIEGQFLYENLPGDADRQFLGPQIAFRIVDDIEAGLRFGFVRFDNDPGNDGSGFSDIDLYAKYRFPGGRTRGAVGALVKAATGDEDEGLGTGAEDVEIFAAWRADMEAVSLTANAGVRFNGSTDPPFPRSEDSFLLGAAVLLPASDRLSFVIEASFESERFENGDNDARLTVGFQRTNPAPGGGFRAGFAIPLSDGAPDFQLIFGGVFAY